jgi:glutathione S-transferase
MSNTAVIALIWCTTVLFLKFAVTISIQGKQRFAAGTRPPEDISLTFFSQGTKQSFGMETTGAEEESLKKSRILDERWKRIVMNDLENIPLGLIVAIVSILAGGNQVLNVVCLIVFTVCRIGHTVTYALELQPHRALFWGTAIVAVAAMAFNGCVGSVME